ncbi:hypothetical protein TNCT_373191 [Trichonephila clavata]|uniref:Uncharacterized protein n=1 Tax=Trichonephila clavata TaxID=2740835 RepID=A0A8X6GN49_TRICU|nr:hypothetical protein TNCT_373191 [Trichonephila clavata]
MERTMDSRLMSLGCVCGSCKLFKLNYRTFWIPVALLMISTFRSLVAFNVDTRTVLVHEGINGSMFGYSIAMHRDRDFSCLEDKPCRRPDTLLNSLNRKIHELASLENEVSTPFDNGFKLRSRLPIALMLP